MQPYQPGFTLIEAMITVLVLSIGLLGLGTLQARLMAAAGELHSHTEANLLATTWLERFSWLATTDPAAIDTEPAQQTRRATVFDTRAQLSSTPGLSTAGIVVEWASRKGLRSTRLGTSACTEAPLSDQRWLLPGR